MKNKKYIADNGFWRGFVIGANRGLWLFFICLLLASCSGTRHLPEGEKLYTGAEIRIETTDKVEK
ncbi:MAG: hypothetical protein RB289_12775, partial [Paludibacter sp.]|nr:hypothetical protein [Paludibacter sp.]